MQNNERETLRKLARIAAGFIPDNIQCVNLRIEKMSNSKIRVLVPGLVLEDGKTLDWEGERQTWELAFVLQKSSLKGVLSPLVKFYD